MNRKLSEFTNKEIRTWALVLTLILGVIGALQFFVWGHFHAARIFWIISGCFLVVGGLLPFVLKPVYWLWLLLAAALAWFNTRLIMFVVFYFVFSPIGLILRLIGKDLIKQKWDKNAASYWIERPREPFDPSRYEKQY